MSIDRLARRLPHVLTELAAPTVPDYFDEILAQTERTSQRPARKVLERIIPMEISFQQRLRQPAIRPGLLSLAVALLILAIAFGVLIVASQRTRLPEPFGRAANGLITYAVDGDIYTVDPETHVVRVVVTGPNQDRDPVWSLDGTHLAFRRQLTSDTSQVWVARSDGSDLRLVTPEPVPLTDPATAEYVVPYAFSPDGRELLLVSRCGPTWIAQTDGSGIRTLDGVTTNGEGDFRPPDGAQIAFVTCSTDAVAIANTDGRGLRQLAGPTPTFLYGSPRWSPDGSWLAYHTWYPAAVWTVRTHVVRADGSGDRLLRTEPVGDFDGGAEWSNDGTRLVIGRGYGDDIHAVVLAVDGSDAGVRSRVPLVTSIQCCSVFEWAPDDSSVLVTPIGESGTPSQQVVLDPRTGEMHPAPWATVSQPSWQRLAP